MLRGAIKVSELNNSLELFSFYVVL